MAKSIEQMCRDLLEQAIKDELVAPADRRGCFVEDPDPQIRTSGELVGMANLLERFLRTTVNEQKYVSEGILAEQEREMGQ